MEYWDIYNINREKTGRIIERKDKENLKENEYHLGIHVGIFNSKGEMLIQKRNIKKRSDPGKWDFSARGSVLKGETSKEGAQRELLEELGLSYSFKDIRAQFTINLDNLFDDYYLIKLDVNLDNLKLQKDEVECVKWATQEEIIQMIENNQFALTKKELINLVFEIYRSK